MKTKKFEDFEAGVDQLFDSPENNRYTTKLERRRRIEELEEEKKLRSELSEFA